VHFLHQFPYLKVYGNQLKLIFSLICTLRDLRILVLLWSFVIGLLKHFVLLIGSPTADSAIQGLMESVFCIHGFPREIITDRDSQFTSSIWSNIMNATGITHKIATTGHHQTVGQAKRLNQHIEHYLRCFIRYFTDKDWTEWLCMV